MALRNSLIRFLRCATKHCFLILFTDSYFLSIKGKLHRFGRRQLREYMKFAERLYDDAKSKLDEFLEPDLVQCVLLTYKDLSRRAEDHLIRWKVFLEYSHKFVSRQQKVWKWQNEKGVCHQMQYRSTEKVQSIKAYK